MNPKKLICVSPARSCPLGGNNPPPKPNSCLTIISFPEPYTLRVHTGLTLYGYMEAHLDPRILVYIYTVLLQEKLYSFDLVPARV